MFREGRVDDALGRFVTSNALHCTVHFKELIAALQFGLVRKARERNRHPAKQPATLLIDEQHQVKKDEVSQISVAWIWDIYPERDKVGTVRLMTPEGFAYPEKMMKIAFLRYNSEKLLNSFKKQIAQRGFLEKIWEGYSSLVGRYADGDSGPSIDPDQSYIWHSKVDEKTVRSWTKIETSQAQQWVKNQVLPRVFDRVRSYLVSSEAKIFADGLVSAKDMLYCSQLVTMAYLEAVNLDVQSTRDEVWEILKYLSSSIKKVLKINIKHRLVSPNGLVWQSDIFENLYTVYLNRDRVEQQRVQKNPTVATEYTHLLEANLSIKSLKIDEEDLINLKSSAINLDLEN